MPTLNVIAPYSGRLIATLDRTPPEEIEKIFARAHTAFCDRRHWLKAHERIRILEKFARLMEQHAESIAQQAAEEGGKPLIDSRVEITRAISGVHVAIAKLHEQRGTQIPMDLSPSSEHRLAYTLREPVGVVLAISAFNHPVNLIIHQVIPALAVGCPVIIKPASSTPLSCLKIVSLLYAADLPEQWCQAILCKPTTIEPYVSDSRVGFLSFIGSSHTGWNLRNKLARGTLCALEHGGSAPVIVEADHHWQQSIPALIKGAFYHAGQVCVSVQRIFIHETIFDAFSQDFTHHAQQLKVGNPLDEKTEVGPINSAQEIERIHQCVEEARSHGAHILCGGEKLSHQCYAPTVISNPPEDIKVSQEEIFGPVVCLYSYHDLDEAIRRANNVAYMFQSAIFTHNLNHAFHAIKNLAAKTVLINDHTAFRVDWMPFGGRKNSGQGVGGIPYSMEELTYEKMFVIHSPDI